MNNEPQLVYKPARRAWPGVVAAGLVAAAIVGAVVANHDAPPMAVVNPAPATAPAAAGPVADDSITSAVKTSLAADPALGTLSIDVTTHDGVVSLEGPAPDEQARERATTLAAASAGVVRVDNKLVVTPAS
jgi:hypothetical protein